MLSLVKKISLVTKESKFPMTKLNLKIQPYSKLAKTLDLKSTLPRNELLRDLA